MRKNGKKLISLALALVMVLTLVPGTAFAAGSWSDWSTTPVYQSDTRQVETRQVKISEAHTEYRYGRYYNAAHNKVCWCATYQESLDGPGSTLDYSAWSATRYSPNSGKSWTCGYCKGSHIGISYYDAQKRPRWYEYTLPGYSGDFFWEESRSVEAQYETQYRYRDIEVDNHLTVTFDANGGSVRAVSLNLALGELYGNLPEPSWENYSFDGWYTAASGGTLITSDTTVDRTGSQTLYAHWTENVAETYIVIFNANGGSVSTASKTVTEGESYGNLPAPTWDGYTFDGWYTFASGGDLVTASTIVTQTQDHTLFAHWTSTVDLYNLGDETYFFKNFSDSDSPGGHCFGMSMTSAAYHNGLLDIGTIGGNANTPLYSFSKTKTVTQPICFYQGKQRSKDREGATVAGGSYYLTSRYDMASDWQEVVSYVRDHRYDGTGLLQIGFRKRGEGGHAINFLRYENVNGQDRIYAYDNNFPTQETYFYRDSSGSVQQAPVHTFSGAIDCIALRDCRKYFSTVDDFDATHVLYMAENAASVEGEYTMTYMETDSADTEYVLYEIPANVDQVTIIPKIDHATFIYMDEEYKFGEITDDTRGELRLAAENAADTDASFRIYEDDSAAAATVFTDVPTSSWYHDAVYWAVEKEITAGTSATTFTPDRTCTETEILTFLWRAAGQPDSTARLPFTPKAAWAADALTWAYEKGMIGASFNENAPCTRAAAVKFIWQAAGCPATAVANSFTDIPAGAAYTQAVAWAVDRGITAGTSAATFSPDNTCTRAEIVTFLYRAYK